MKSVVLKVLSTDPAAVEATARTIENLAPGLHRAVRNQLGEIVLTEGEMEVASSDPDYIAWAAPRQGYVESARVLSAEAER